jgi:polysaccharide deacetylase family sporulation protein PdaB
MEYIMEFEIDKDKLRRFVKSGIIVLSVILVLAAGIYVVPQIIAKASGSSSRKLPIYCVDCEDKKVALSFDAAWGNEDTARILEILAKHEVKVTFFMTGGWVEKYPEDVKAIVAAGHDLGNHSENHKQMSKLSMEQCNKEIMDVHDKVKTLTGVDMVLFRPPYGDYNNTLIESVNSCGYHCIQWNVDSLDWKDYGAECIVKKVVEHKNLSNGSIILCHNGAKFTADALESMILGLREKGYEIVPISQLIYTENYEMDHEGRQHQK